ncbi:MAG: hypothetical protein ABEI86_00170 [Halobacteriaceae archaeon]
MATSTVLLVPESLSVGRVRMESVCLAHILVGYFMASLKRQSDIPEVELAQKCSNGNDDFETTLIRLILCLDLPCASAIKSASFLI